MRKPLIIAGGIAGAAILVIAGLFVYAAANLNSLIAQNRERILDRVSASLGRKVEVGEIKAHLGWGVSADLSGLRIADDSRFSNQPFVSASDVYARVELLPLLGRQVRISRIVLSHPEIRIIRNADGTLNLSSIGKKNEQEEMAPQGESQEKKARGGAAGQSPLSERRAASSRGAAQAVEVRNLSVEDGRITYEAEGHPPLAISHIDVDLRNFSLGSPFEISLRMAAMGDEQNIDLSGEAGPIVSEGRIEPNEIPVDLKLTAGPFTLDQVQKLGMVKGIPPQLKISEGVKLQAAAKGKLDSMAFHAGTDLTSNGIEYGDSFRKPAGTAMKVQVDAARTGSAFAISNAKLALGELDLKATKIDFGGGRFSGRIDTNRFDIGSLAAMAPAAAKLGITGKSEIHTDVVYEGGKTDANGVITLAGLSIPRSSNGGSAVSDLSGDIRLEGSAADIGPLSFRLGTGQATLKAHADPIYPTKATYQFSADSLRTADFAPKRPADERLNQVKAEGTLAISGGSFADDNRLTSPSGILNNISYNALTVVSSLAGKKLRVSQLAVGAFGGNVTGNADADLEEGGPFSASVVMANLNLQQALESQKAKAAGVVRGLLSGRVQLAGRNRGDFEAIKPTLDGGGQIQVAQGKLVGVNIGAEVFKKTQNLPVIGSLVPESIANNHPELFRSPDTDFQQMGLTFVINGPRIISHDIVMKTADYALNGDGWFDMDKNIDLTARILLTQQLTREIVEQKKNVVYVTNSNGQVDIPLRITGQLPKPKVMPDVTELAQRATQRAVQEKGQKALGKALGDKGLGKFLGGSGSGGGTPPSNPLNQLKGLFGR